MSSPRHPFNSGWRTNRHADPLKESTQKRHYYYCRSKLPDTSSSRKRSCAACVRAKTRCIWSVETGHAACARCSRRGVECEFDAAARQHRTPDQHDPVPTSSAESRVLPGPEAQAQAQGLAEGFLTDTSLAMVFNNVQSPRLDTPSRACGTMGSPVDPLPNWLWQADIELQVGNRGDEDAPPWSRGFDERSRVLLLGAYAAAKWKLGITLSSPSPFDTRVFTRPDQRPLVTVAMQLLRSFPFMVLRKGAVPPFINPWLYSKAGSGKGPPQQVSITPPPRGI